MKEIGLTLGVVESRVSQIHSAAVLRLRVALAALQSNNGDGGGKRSQKPPLEPSLKLSARPSSQPCLKPGSDRDLERGLERGLERSQQRGLEKAVGRTSN